MVTITRTLIAKTVRICEYTNCDDSCISKHERAQNNWRPSVYEVSSFLTTVLKLAYELDWFLHLCCLPVLKLSACVQLVGQWHSLAWYLSTGSLSFWFLYCTSTLRTFPSSILWKGSRYNSELLVAAYLVVILDKYHIPYWFVASCSVPLLTHNQTRKEISGTLLPKSVYDAFNELIAMFGVTCLPEMATWYPWPVWPTPAGDRSDKGKGHHLVSRS